MDQCWVTTAYDDRSALKAIVLAKSLRRVATTRRLAVIFCEDVTKNMKNVLLNTFDQCLKLEPTRELNGIPVDLYARVFCWNVPFIRKCVFLHPNTLVLRNCDELFEQPGIQGFKDVEAGIVDSSVLIVEPSILAYEKLMNWMKSGKIHEGKTAAYENYSAWIEQQRGFKPLPEKYNVRLQLGEKTNAASKSLVSVVQFSNFHPLELPTSQLSNLPGVFEKAVLEFYFATYNGIDLNKSLECQAIERYALPTIPQSYLDSGKEPIAIIGMSCRFPMANNAEEYWNILFNGEDCIRKVPEDRWPSAITDEAREIQAGFLKCPVDEFDGKFFNVSPFELSLMDPQQRLLLEVTWEALEDAGINPQVLKGTNTGAFVGTWTQDYRELVRDTQGLDTDFHRTYMGNSLGGSGGRISFLLGLTGPNIATESGCSSGMVAVYLACESLRKRRTDMALAAGANLLLYPFQKKHMVNVVAPDGRCKTFDEKADGFGRAEGVATLVLKRYSDAIKAGDNVLALIRGCGISQEGLSRSFGTPTKEVQEIAMKTALADAGLEAADISFVEAHGTGTVVGDPIEMAAIASVYCKNVERTKPLYVASGKTNIGHAESCSGFAGIIKVILSMQHRTIPPHLHLQNLNPYIQLDNLPLEIPSKPLEWEPIPGKPRIAGVSSFGITGTDAHVIIQEPPTYTPAKLSLDVHDRPHHLFTFSGKSEQALSDVLGSFSTFLESSPDIDLGNAAYTLNAGRAHFMHRVGVMASSVSDLVKKLKGASKSCKLVPETQPKLCFLFTGQGSQYPGMARQLYETNAVFKINFDLCDKILQDLFKISIKPILWSSEENPLLHRSLFSQTSIFCVEYCLMKLWESWGVKPDAVLGHSLGEFAACVCAGILDLKEAITLVGERSRLIEGIREGKMVVIKANEELVDGLLKEFLYNNKSYWMDYAAVNSPEQTVLAGPPQAVEAFALFCSEKNLKTHVLDATSAFHSRDMDEIIPEYEKVTGTIKRKPRDGVSCSYISGVKGGICEAGEINSTYWIAHTRDRVRFMEASKAAYEHGCRLFLEVGPQPVLCALAMTNISGESSFDEPITVLPSLRKKEDEWVTLLSTLTKLYQLGFQIDWDGFDQYYNRRKISLPKYPFNRKKYWYETKDNQGNGLMVQGKLLHPLLGCQIPNATTTNMFQNSVDVEKLEYLKDHGIGGQIVFPAAAYLELALKSGNICTIGEIDAAENLMNPISIEKMTIEAPLGLSPKESCHMQTIVMKTDSAENKVSIYTQRKNGGGDGVQVASSSIKWIRQASGTFVPLQANMITQAENEESLSSVRSRCLVEVETKEFYEKLDSVGLQFGETFRSLGRLWKNEGNENEILSEIIYPNMSQQGSSSSSNKHYICHPVVLDALIQTIMFGMGKVKETLYVPVVIEKVIVFSKLDFTPDANSDASAQVQPQLFGHCKWEANQPVHERSATLFDANGKIVAVMKGVTMIETSTDVILKTLSNQQLALPDMYEEVWRAKSGPFKNRANLPAVPDALTDENDDKIDEKGTSSKDLNLLNEKERASVLRRDILIFNYILKALYNLGWKPKLEDILTSKDLIDKLGITQNNELLVQRFLRIFQEEGLAQEITSPKNSFRLIKLPPSETEVERIIEQMSKEGEEAGENLDFQVVQTCGQKLSSILSGKISALSVLYGENTEVNAEAFYNTCNMLPKFFIQLQHVFRKILRKYSELPEEQRGVLRVLEIGAGTASSTKIILPVFEEFGAKFQYTFTDISPAFFGKAEGLFENYGRRMQYKVLNIEEDPLGQGFVPQHFDIIFASNVLHATKDITESVRNTRILLKDEGYFVLAETLKEIRDYDIVFGLLDGYWRFVDRDVRKWYPTVDATCWKKLCLEEGFDKLKEYLCFDGRLGVIAGKATKQYGLEAKKKNKSGVNEKSKWWLVFASKERYVRSMEQRMKKYGRNVILVSQLSPSKDHSSSSSSLIEVSENHFEVGIESKEGMQKLFGEIIKGRELVIEGILYMWGMEEEEDHLRKTHGLLFLSQVLLSDFKGLPRLILVTEGIIRVDDESACDISSATLCGMAKSFRTEHFNMHVKSVDLDPDEQDEELKYDELLTELWNDDQEFQICYRQRYRHVARLTTCKDFASPLLLPKCDRFSLALPPTKNIADLKFCPNGKPMLKDNQIEIKVRAYGLNFRDIFTVLKPNEEFEKWNTVGLEFSGVVVGVGQNVTQRKVGDYVIGCNFSEGALPSHLCMDEDMVFEMPEDVTFCEAATIPAAFATAYYCLVTIAGLSKGETVLVHAGSGGVGLFALQVARAVGAEVIATAGSRRKRQFLRNLGIKHVFHSRNTDYGKQIPEVTGGKGVQVVLNSLTSPGFKEATLGCCSPGARFVEMSKLHIWTEEEVRNLRPDVAYTVVDLTKVEKDTWKSIWGAIREYLAGGHLKPVHFIQYDATCVREALTYMQKAKHIGKIIITMPCMEQKENELVPVNHLFSDRATYLLTGGLGGIGMELAKWMCQHGAKHLIVTSRRAPDERAVKIINELNSKGNNVISRCLDVGDYDQCKSLLEEIKNSELNLPKLRGIFHLAGTLADATYTNQTVEMYKQTFQGKVYGAIHLHDLTKDTPLEFFMLFSSMAAIFGPIGQSNYAGANMYLDALAHYRHSIGLCGQSINWGQWGDVGLSKDIKIPALRPFSPAQAFSALEVVMRSQKNQVSVLDVDFSVVRKLTANIGAYLEELKITKEANSVALDVKINNFWQDFDAAEDDDGKEGVIKSYVCNILRQILKLDDDETIDENQKFSEMGMDSLMMLEMKNFIQTMLGKNITMNVSELAELTTVNKLASHLMGLIKANKEDSGEKQDENSYNHFTSAQKALIEDDLVLPEKVKAVAGTPCKRSEIKTLLLTGVTGKLGPYMAEALAKRQTLEKIFCIIRSKDDTSARDRLIKVLEEKSLCETVDLSKLECIAGDITQERFGFTQEKYDALAMVVDGVVHCAVKGNLMEPYKKREGKNLSNDLRSVNVIGTVNVLEFAGAGKPKPVLHASTLLACHKVSPDGLLLEDWSEKQDIYEMPNVGYPISKFICEHLCHQAAERGIPTHVHRFPGLLGDKNGCFSFPNNHAMLRLLGFCKLGVMPANPIPLQLLDVDVAADVSCQLFFNDDAQPDVYNITNPHMCMLQDFPELSNIEFGFPIEIVEYKEFFQKLHENDEYASLFPYREVDFDGDRFVDFTASPVALQSWINNPQEFFTSRKLKQVLEDYEVVIKHPIEILRRDMQFAKDHNIFSKFGLLPKSKLSG